MTVINDKKTNFILKVMARSVIYFTTFRGMHLLIAFHAFGSTDTGNITKDDQK